MTSVEMNSEKSIEFAYKISNIYYFPEKKTMDTNNKVSFFEDIWKSSRNNTIFKYIQFIF